MRKYNKKNTTMGGGVEQKSSFKPLIASSLALALGVSVAIAQPTVTGGSIGDSITWTENDGYDTTSTSTITAQGGVTTTLTSTQGIKITNGQNANGTLTISMGNTKNATKFILDLSDVSSEKAFVGNLTVSGSTYDGNRRFQGIFGKDFVGNIILNSGGYTNTDNPSLIFNNGAKLEGNLTVSFEDTYITFSGKNDSDESGKITGGVTKNSSGNLTIDFDSTKGGSIGSFTATNGNSTINNLTYIYNNNGTNANDVVTISGGTNVLNFLDNGVITGNVNFSSGTTTMTNLATINGNIKATAPNSPGRNNYSTLTLSDTVVNGDIILDKYTYYNHWTSIFGVKSANNIKTMGEFNWQQTKKMLIVFSDSDVSVKGNIQSIDEAITELVFSQATSATLQSNDNSAINITANYREQGGASGNYSKNVLVFGANTTAKIGTMSSSGDYGWSPSPGYSFNALSFNDDTANLASINKMTSTRSYNIVGKNLMTYNSSNSSITYNTALFGDGGYRQTHFNGSVTEFVKSTHSASGTFTFGDNSADTVPDAIVANLEGKNYINANGTTTIKGNILSSVTSSSGATSGHNNLIVLTGTSATLGEDSKAISIKVNNGGSYSVYSNNTLLLGATTNTLKLSELSVTTGWPVYGDKTKNFNALSINSGTTTANIQTISSSYGSNIIGKDLIIQGDSSGSGSGYNTALFTGSNNGEIKSSFATTFMSNVYTAAGTYTLGDITANDNGTNYINVNTFTISSLNANGGSNHIGFTANSQVTGSISKSNSGANNFTYLADNATLTLQGSTNAISTLTAYAPSTRASATSTLTIDGTTQANNTTIDSVINGGNLVVNFNGQGTDKSATLKISSLTGDTLKAITLGDSSTNNTLDLTALRNTTISEAISVGASQGLNINLTNTALTTNGWSNAGTSVINVNGSATANSTLKGGNVELTSLNLNATTSTSMTLQNTSTTIGTLTSSSSSTNGNTLALGFSSPSITTQTNDVSATITNKVDGSNLTLVFNGGEDRSTSLTLNSGDNTFKALSLGSNQSTHNTLILNNGKTTIEGNISVGNSATQEIAFNLANGTELALTGGLTKGDNGFANLNVLANSSATLSGGGVGLTNLNMGLDTSASSLTFKNTTTTIGTLTSNATATQINTLIMGEGSSNVTVNNTAKGTKFNLTYNDGTTNGAKTFTLTGGENAIKEILVSDSGANTLSVTGGSTTIDTITAENNNFTLALSSNTDASNPSSTLVTVNSAISGGNVTFSDGINPADQLHFSTLLLKGANTIDSMTTSATNAKLVMQDTATADIADFTFGPSGGYMLLGFEGSGDSTITLGGNGTTVGAGQTLGISIGGRGQRAIKVLAKEGQSISFGSGSTLVVDFQRTQAGDNITATLGNNSGFTIDSGSNSIINLYGGEGQSRLDGSITLSGGTNTINFLDTATMGTDVITLTNGTNIINVYGAESAEKAITGTMGVSQIGNVDNTINLYDYSTLKLTNGNDIGELKTTANNTLNFLGDNATLQGGFGLGSGGSGTATINVGSNNTTTGISGLITGDVSDASVIFKGTLDNGDSSKLTLKGATNTLTGLTTNSTNAILVLDASQGDITTTLKTGDLRIDANKSITIALHSTKTSNNDATFNVSNGNIVVYGTLGIAISGDGEGNRSITANGGAQPNFQDGSTLRVDFLSGSKGSATLGGENSFTIGSGRNSEINFYAGSTATLAGGGLILDGGSNTVNFYGNATLGQIQLQRGNNTINVKEGVTAKIESTDSTLGSVTNTINLDANSILQLEAGTNTNNADGSIVTTQANTLNFNGSNATLKGGFGLDTSGGVNSGVKAQINVKNTGALITGDVSNADVEFSEVSGSTLTLQGATNTLNALGSTNTNITGTIILDAKTSAVSATITSAVAATSSVGLKFGAGGNEKTFTFSASGNNLSGVEFDEGGSTNNKLAFINNNNTITSAFSLQREQGLTIALGDSNTNSGTDQSVNQISLALTGGFSKGEGSATLRVEGQNTADALISGGDISVNSLTLDATTSASLTLQNSSVSIGTLTAQSANNTLKLDASNDAVSTTIANTLEGDQLTIALAGSQNYTATLNLNGANNTIYTLSLSEANNFLVLNNGLTTFSNDVNVDVDKNITFNLANSTTLAFEGDNTFESSGNATFNIQGASIAINGAITTNGGTTTLALIDGSSLTLNDGVSTSGGNTNINFTGTSSVIGDFSTDTSNSVTTAINLSANANGSITGDISNSNSATTTLTYGNNASLTLRNGTQGISTLTLSANNSTSTLNLSNQAETTIGNALTLDNSKNLNVNIDNTSSLTLADLTTSSGAFNASGNGSLTATSIASSSTSGSNTINVGTLTLSGNLTATQGAQNNITADTLSIGAIVTNANTADSNKNTITANTATFLGNITAGADGEGWLSQNFITVNGNVTFSNNSATIQAKNIGNTNTEKTNILKFGGKVEGTIAELTALTLNSNQTKTKNILSFDGNDTSTLTITNINIITADGNNKTYASGNTYIGKNLTSGSGENLALSFNESNWSSSNYTANLNLTVTGTILSKRGGTKNFINVASLTAGTITNDGSTNNIATSGNFTASTIQSSWGGTNNIIIGGNAEIGTIGVTAGNGGNTNTNNITFYGANTQSVVKGDISALTSTISKNNLTLSGSNATLTLEGKDTEATTHAITTFNASGANTTLVLDNSKVTTGAMSTTISTLSNGANLTATLKGNGSSKEATLALNGGTLKALTLGEGSTGNILDLSNATSALSITNQVNVGNNQDLTIKLKNTTLALNGGLNTSGNGSKIELVGDDTNTSNATLTGGAVALSNLALSATTSNTLTISSSSAVIDSISASGTTSNTIALNGTRTTINSAIDVNDSGNKPLSFNVTNSTLVFGSSDNTITSLTSNGGLVDLSAGVKPQTPYAMARSVALASNGASARNTLTINDTFTGEATFKLYASQTQSDRVVFGATQASQPNATLPIVDSADDSQPTTPSPTGVAIISITGGNDVFSITESDKVIVATRTDDSVEIVGGESYIGGAKVGVTIGAMSDDANTFIIKNAIEIEADPIYQEVASSALAVNYDLYLANFNSLNKRMGELRDNDHNQGVWARVFGGNMSNDFGAGSKTDYLTAQAGYDYSLSVGENARNFMGIALAYGTSSTKGNSSYASNSNNAGLSLDKV
ncbi:hypothetical protein, partial [Helicobacter brantae]